MVLLVTSDNEQFVTDRDIVERSVLIKNMLEGTYLHSLSSPVSEKQNESLIIPPFYRRRRVRSAHSFAKRVVQRSEEGTLKHHLTH